MRRLIIILFLLASTYLSAQKSYFETTQTTIDGKYAYVSLPASYNDSFPKRYPVIVFFPGNGEVGANYNTLKTYGPHEFIVDQGYKGFTNPYTGDTTECIVISIQPSGQWTGSSQVNEFVDTIMYSNRWRVDTFRVNATGLSAGGWMWANHITSTTKRRQQIASMVLMHHPITDNGAGDAAKHSLMADYVRQNGTTGFQIWGFEDSVADGRKMNKTRDSCNNAVAGSYRYTGRPTVASGHSGWNNWYNPTYTESVGGTTMNIYQWMLTRAKPGAYQYWDDPQPFSAYAGEDFSIIWDQGGNQSGFTINGSAPGNQPDSWQWSFISGPATPILVNENTATLSVYDANLPGIYGFELLIDSAGHTDRDTVYVDNRDIMKKGMRPCREGGGIRHYVTDASPGVNGNEWYAPYITRDNHFPTWQGGDTVFFLMSSKVRYTFGDLVAPEGCPIYFASDTAGTTTITTGGISGSNAMYIANADSNVVGNVHIIGDWQRETKGIYYGWRIGNPELGTGDNLSMSDGIAANLVWGLKVSGVAFNNVGHGIQIKTLSDSTKPFKIYNNFRNRNIEFCYNYIRRTRWENAYLGSTTHGGVSQANNDGPTVQGDSLFVHHNVSDSIGLDGWQVANFTYAEVHDNLMYKSGTSGDGSHNWLMLVGGYSSDVHIYNNYFLNGTGYVGSLGQGLSEFRQNIFDSLVGVYNSQGVETGIVLPHPDSLQLVWNGNIFLRTTAATTYVTDMLPTEWIKKDSILNNIFVHSTYTNITQHVSSSADGGYYANGNTIVTGSYNLDTSPLKDMPAYRLYKEVFQPGRETSFWELSETPPVDPPDPTWRGHRIKSFIPIKIKN